MRLKLTIPKGWPLKFTLTRIGKRKLDTDNLITSLKWIRDALADYFFPNLSKNIRDEHSLVQWNYAQEIGSEYYLRIEVELQEESK